MVKLNVTIEQMASEIKKYSEFTIVYHIRPDGDCIGSSYALALALKAAGAKCRVEGDDEIPLNHRYLTDEVIMDDVENPVYIAVDSAAPDRVGSYADRHFTFCIDHHSNSFCADFIYTEKDCGACSELIFKLIKAMNVEISPQMADFMYLALAMDTMCFRTTDTSAQSFRTAAELAELGADIYGIGRRHLYIKKPGRMKIERMLQSSFNFTCDGQIVSGVITRNNLKEAQIQDSELEGINSYVELIEGIKVGITVRELADGRSRCSVRTSGNVSAHLICRTHGGGGHFNAAGCVLDCPVEETRTIMEKTAREILEQSLHD